MAKVVAVKVARRMVTQAAIGPEHVCCSTILLLNPGATQVVAAQLEKHSYSTLQQQLQLQLYSTVTAGGNHSTGSNPDFCGAECPVECTVTWTPVSDGGTGGRRQGDRREE